MSENWTKGPWFNGTDVRQIESQEGVIVCNVSGAISNKEVLGDSYFIATAPELYEALEQLLSYTRACESLLNASEAGQCRKANTVLAKARGETDE